jgi:hypothetical protein
MMASAPLNAWTIFVVFSIPACSLAALWGSVVREAVRRHVYGTVGSPSS